MAHAAGTAQRAEMRDELRATVEARRDLGDGYDEFLIEDFLTRLERRAGRRQAARRNDEWARVARLFFSLLFAMPLTAIGAMTGGWPAVLIIWTALFLLNYRR